MTCPKCGRRIRVEIIEIGDGIADKLYICLFCDHKHWEGDK